MCGQYRKREKDRGVQARNLWGKKNKTGGTARSNYMNTMKKKCKMGSNTAFCSKYSRPEM